MTHNEIQLKQFETILEEMKADYQRLINELPNESYLITGRVLGIEVLYVDQYIRALNLEKVGTNIVALVMGIQKGKYDGSANSFECCTR